MYQITDGNLQIANLCRVEEVQLQQSHRVCKSRRWDSFAFILGGGVDYHMAGRASFTLSAGDVHYLPLGCNYTMDIHPEGVHYIVCDFVCITQGPRQDLWFSPANPQIYEKLFRELNLHFASDSPTRHPDSLAVLFRIYAQLVRDHHPGYVSGTNKKNILAAHDTILQHLADPSLSVQQLAARAHMSQVHFRRLFHAVYGTSPAKYITATRIAKAKSLLGLSEMRLEEIAAQTGFSSVAYFCSVFKAATGLTPGQYRSRL